MRAHRILYPHCRLLGARKSTCFATPVLLGKRLVMRADAKH